MSVSHNVALPEHMLKFDNIENSILHTFMFSWWALKLHASPKASRCKVTTLVHTYTTEIMYRLYFNLAKNQIKMAFFITPVGVCNSINTRVGSIYTALVPFVIN